MEIEIVKKAWSVNPSNMSEAWCFDTDNIYHGTRGQAKALALIDNDGGKTMKGEDISICNIRVLRCKEFDEVHYHGDVIKRFEIKEKEREYKIKSLPKDKTYYVQDKRSYVGNAVLWWGWNGNGYVTDLSKAHKYTWEEIQSFNPRDTDMIWESGHVEAAVRNYVEIQGLRSEHSI